VNKRRVPVYAVAVICVLAWALMIPTLANAFIGYLVGTSIAVIGLYIAFAIPIFLRLRHGERFEKGSWSLGGHYRWIGVLSLIWIIVISLLFLAPVSPKGVPGNPEFSWEVVNYAPITVGGALILFGGWYLISAHKWFKGPVREGETEQELESIEKSLD
jgi:hypothetical protein